MFTKRCDPIAVILASLGVVLAALFKAQRPAQGFARRHLLEQGFHGASKEMREGPEAQLSDNFSQFLAGLRSGSHGRNVHGLFGIRHRLKNHATKGPLRNYLTQMQYKSFHPFFVTVP